MWPKSAADTVRPGPRASTQLHRLLYLAVAIDGTKFYYATDGIIAVNVIPLERGFNACKTPRCIPIYLLRSSWRTNFEVRGSSRSVHVIHFRSQQ